MSSTTNPIPRNPPFNVIVWCAYKPIDPLREFPLEVGQVITVMVVDKRGAWFGTKNKENRTLWFPASYTKYADNNNVIIAPTQQQQPAAAPPEIFSPKDSQNPNTRMEGVSSLTRPSITNPSDSPTPATKTYSRSKSLSQSRNRSHVVLRNNVTPFIPPSRLPYNSSSQPQTSSSQLTQTSPSRPQISSSRRQISSSRLPQASSPQLPQTSSSQPQTSSPQLTQTNSPQLSQISSPQLLQTSSQPQTISPQLPQTNSPQLPQINSPQLPQTSSSQPQTSSPQLTQTSSPQLIQTSPSRLPQTSSPQLPHISSFRRQISSSQLPKTSSSQPPHQLTQTSPARPHLSSSRRQISSSQLPKTSSSSQLPQTSSSPLVAFPPGYAPPPIPSMVKSESSSKVPYRREGSQPADMGLVSPEKKILNMVRNLEVRNNSNNMEIGKNNINSEIPKDKDELVVKDQKRRFLAIKELIETEVEYNRDLKTLDSIRLKLTEKKFLPADIMSQIFSNVSGLSTVNQLIQTKIEEEQAKIGDPEENLFKLPIGPIYLSLAPFLKMYLQYCENHDNALIVLAKHKKKNKQLDNWLNQEAEKCKGLFLKDFLIKPVQRLCKYPLLIQNLLNHTPEDEPDYHHLNSCLEMINDIVMDINEIRGKNINFTTLSTYEENIVDYNGTLLSQTRQFIREGSMFVQEDKPNRILNMKKSDAQERVILLFNDKILFCKKNTYLGSKNHYLRFIFELETDTLVMSPTNSEHPEHDISLVLEKSTDNKKVWMIFFENLPDKNAWFNILQETIQEEKQRKIQEETITIPDELFNLDPNEIKEKDMRTLLSLFLSPQGISIKNRKVKLKTYRNCFLGKDMVNWLCEKNITKDRASAVIIGQKFIDLKYMKHIGEENGLFKDDTMSPYRFDSISMVDRELPRNRARSHGPVNQLIIKSPPAASGVGTVLSPVKGTPEYSDQSKLQASVMNN